MLKLHGLDVPIRVVQSARRTRTITLQVVRDAIIVRCPQGTSSKTILDVLVKRQPWLEQTLERVRSKEPEPSRRFPVWLNEAIWFQGVKAPVHVHPETSTKWEVTLDENGIHIHTPHGLSAATLKFEHDADQHLKRWLREYAGNEILQRVQYWATRLGYSYGTVRIKEMKTRWGSCSQKRNLNFNWLLIGAPKWVLDYVIVHELCHLKELNHSSRFWRLVATSFPRFEEAKQWLRRFGHELFMLNTRTP